MFLVNDKYRYQRVNSYRFLYGLTIAELKCKIEGVVDW